MNDHDDVPRRSRTWVFPLVLVLVVAIVVMLCSCERENPPQLTIVNEYHQGTLQLLDSQRNKLLEQEFVYGQVREVHLDPGDYLVLLLVDACEDPRLTNLGIRVNISSRYTFCTVVLKDNP